MQRTGYFYQSYAKALSLLLAVSSFASGCHRETEPIPIPSPGAKKETVSQGTNRQTQSIWEVDTKAVPKVSKSRQKKNQEAAVKLAPSVTTLPENNKPVNPFNNSNREKTKRPEPVGRNPFAVPEILRKEQKISPGQPEFTNQVEPSYPPDPCIAGIFDNGKERFVLLRWQQAQGVFREKESLGNGYYVKEITVDSVLLCPEQNDSGGKAISLVMTR